MDRPKLLRFLRGVLEVLPGPYVKEEINRVTLLYFVAGSLDLLDELTPQDKKRLVDWVYSLQVLPEGRDREWTAGLHLCGFRGGPLSGRAYRSSGCPPAHSYDGMHIASTYRLLGLKIFEMGNGCLTMTSYALCILKMCGDDLSRVCRNEIIASVVALQKKDGSFLPSSFSEECDMRFVYCAICVLWLLKADFSVIDTDRLISFIMSTRAHEGVFAQGPHQEGHGGPTFLAVASLTLLNRSSYLKESERDVIIRWLVDRQIGGFQGRVNKIADTCYSWWCGAALGLLGAYHYLDTPPLRSFHLTCQSSHLGGFSKNPEVFPDVLHTYFSLASLSMMGEEGLQELDLAIGLTKRASSSVTAFSSP